jgi:hypothetical protein
MKNTDTYNYYIPAAHDRAEVRCRTLSTAIRHARELVAEGYPAHVYDRWTGRFVWSTDEEEV